MSSKLEPAIWSCDTGQPVPYFDRCQLTTTGMSNIKGRLTEVWLPSCVTLTSLPSRCAPTSNTASHNNQEKIYSWVFFSLLYEYWRLLGGPLGCYSSAIKLQYFHVGPPPKLIYEIPLKLQVPIE